MTDKNSDKVIALPDNLIGREDRQRLESFGGHEMARGRATRFHWDKDENGNPVFEIFRGGNKEKLVVRIGRHREKDEFFAEDSAGNTLVTGALDHVMAVLDKKLAHDHGENSPA